MTPLRIIFAGTPEFAVPALARLMQSGHEVVMVLTQPDRPSGRGLKLKASPVKELALTQSIPVFQPENLRDLTVQETIRSVEADVMVVAAYGLIIPQVVLDMPRLGCFNIHASLLPRWRGAAPIQRAILAGDKETGVTIMSVVMKLDAGGMIKKGITPISEQDTAQSLHDRISEIGAVLMLDLIESLSQGKPIELTSQDEQSVTYAEKLQKSEALIDWSKSAGDISRQIRAFNPFPVAQTTLGSEVLRVWMAQVSSIVHPSQRVAPGTIVDLDEAIHVACGEGILRIEELQLPGGKRLSAREFLAGAKSRGDHLLGYQLGMSN
jgi:methionyl-tRNA formyltransferase